MANPNPVRNCAPFPKGVQSRPASVNVTAEMREAVKIARAKTPKAMQTLIDLLDNNSASIRLQASQAILARVFGAPTQPLKIEEGNTTLEELPREQRMQVYRDAAARFEAAIAAESEAEEEAERAYRIEPAPLKLAADK